MDKKELKRMYEEIQSLEKELDNKEIAIREKVYKEVEKLERLLEQVEEKADEEYKEKTKALDESYKALNEKKKEFGEKLEEFNKESWKEFVSTVKKYVDEGWIIEEVAIDERWEKEIIRTVGDDLYTNFRPEDRVLTEILPTKTGFKYRVLWNSGKRRGETTETRISVKYPESAEVKLVNKLQPKRTRYGPQRAYINVDGVQKLAKAYLVCPICNTPYGEFELNEGEKIIKRLPDCPHRDMLLPYGEKQKSIEIKWTRTTISNLNAKPIRIYPH